MLRLEQTYKWGNSLIIKIPKRIVDELNWNEQTQICQKVVGGKLVIEAVESPVYTLEQLLEGVTADNLHGEVESGPAVGRESHQAGLLE